MSIMFHCMIMAIMSSTFLGVIVAVNETSCYTEMVDEEDCRTTYSEEACSEKMYEVCGTSDCHSEQLELCSPDQVDEVCRIRKMKDCSGDSCVSVDRELCRLVPQPDSACQKLISKSCKVAQPDCDWMLVPQCGRVLLKECSTRKVPKWTCSTLKNQENEVLSALGATSAMVRSTMVAHLQGLMGNQQEEGPQVGGDVTDALRGDVTDVLRNRRSAESLSEEDISASLSLGLEEEQLVKVEDLMADTRILRFRHESEPVGRLSNRPLKVVRKRSPEPVPQHVDRKRRSPEPLPEPGDRRRRSPEPLPEPVKRRRSPEPIPEPGDRMRRSPEPVPEPVDRQRRSLEPVPEPAVYRERRSPEPVPEPLDRKRKSPEPVPEPVDRKRRSPEPVPEPVDRKKRSLEPIPEHVDRQRRSPEPVPEPVMRRRSPVSVPEPVDRKIRSPEPVAEPVKKRSLDPSLELKPERSSNKPESVNKRSPEPIPEPVPPGRKRKRSPEPLPEPSKR